jgi:hypothetical protein
MRNQNVLVAKIQTNQIPKMERSTDYSDYTDFVLWSCHIDEHWQPSAIKRSLTNW